MENIRQKIKKNKVLYTIAHYGKYIVYWFYEKWACFAWAIKSRSLQNGIIKQDPRFEGIKKLKNTHVGERCFIVATGPSVKMEDLEALEGEFTISMNSILNVLPNVRYRPDIYICQDNDVFKALKDKHGLLDPKQIFIGIGNINTAFARCNIMKDVEKYMDINLFHNDVASIIWQFMFRDVSRIRFKFSDDCYRDIKDGTTVTYSAVQLAAYMGFKEIYMIGVDCNYSGKLMHIGEYNAVGFRMPDSFCNTVADKFNNLFGNAEKILKKRGVSLYNATRGGNLTAVTRIDFDELVKKEKGSGIR